MRKITSDKDLAKRQKKNQLVLGIILVVLMLLSVLGYGFYGSEESYEQVREYRGHELFSNGELWILDYGVYRFGFSNHPADTSGEVDLELKTLENYLSAPLYLSSNDSRVNTEISNNFGYIAERIQLACLQGEVCEEGLPVKNCSSNFIVVSSGEANKIDQESNCVFIEGNGELTEVVDEFLFHIIGIK